MRIDVLVAEIGSTTTVVNAFDGVMTPEPVFLGQGQSRTTVEDGDVTKGLQSAMEDLRIKLGAQKLDYGEMFATSSAAGGLRMTVHGLVYDMTVRAAKEAALGAGANLKLVTAGRMRKSDAGRLAAVRPNIILIAGGVDYGERETALHNAEVIASMGLGIPVVYAGNVENADEIREIFKAQEAESLLYVTENVYPRIDELNVEPTRAILQEVFEAHIIHAPGMEKIKELVDGAIVPTPGAVMEAAKLLKSAIGDLVVVDVGGATTDVHSVTLGSDEVNRILMSPEPEAKRTVEGDLGVYVNMANILEMMGEDQLREHFGEELDQLIEHYRFVPRNGREEAFVEKMTEVATLVAIDRHSGRYRDLYGTSGKKTYAEGKDLTAAKWLIGTGGALTRLRGGTDILKRSVSRDTQDKLNPPADVGILIDHDYIMASLGALSKKYPKCALALLQASLGKEGRQ